MLAVSVFRDCESRGTSSDSKGFKSRDRVAPDVSTAVESDGTSDPTSPCGPIGVTEDERRNERVDGDCRDGLRLGSVLPNCTAKLELFSNCIKLNGDEICNAAGLRLVRRRCRLVM